jgi:hypothetical protein
MSKKFQLVQIVDKNGTPVEVTSDGELRIDGTITIETSATVRTTAISRPINTTGTVAAGARSVSFFNAGSDDCTVKTVALKAGEVITFDAGGEDDTLDAIAWTANTSGATEMLIIEVR